MFEKFKDYLYYLIPRSFKKAKQIESDIYKLFSPTGKLLDDQKANIFLVRRQSMIATASGKGLDLTGKDRKMPRYAKESDEQYRKRQLNKFDVAIAAGTEQGIIKAIKALGYEEVVIERVADTDPTRWAEFYVIITENESLDILGNLDIIKKTVREVKQASSLPVYLLNYNYSTGIDEELTAMLLNKIYWFLDGTYSLDGTKKLGPDIEEVTL